MPSRRERYLDALLEAFIKKTERKKRSEVTVKGYRWMIKKVQRELLEAELDGEPVFSLPSKWDEETVLYIRDVIYGDNLPSVVRRNISVLGTYAQFHGNTIVKDLELEWPSDERIHVDWLDPDPARRVMEASQGLERIIIHLEMKLGLRRVEVLRLKLKDIGAGYLNVLGKGRQGGKLRTVNFHPETLGELEYYFKLRDFEVQKAQSMDGSAEIPNSLLIYFGQDGKLHSYKRTAIDKRLKRVNERTNLKFTNHTLRRTYGRNLWLAGAKLETISNLMGHEDTKTTIQYLGLRMDDQAEAMQLLARFEEEVKKRAQASGYAQDKNLVQNGEASISSGQSGI